MEGANLGNIFASITLYTKPLTAGISSARNALSEMAESFLWIVPGRIVWRREGL